MRSLTFILIIASSFVLAVGQTTDPSKDAPKSVPPVRREKLRDLPFPAGINLQFIIKELAQDLNINVMFDPAFPPGKKSYFDLRNVSAREAMELILLQENLYYERVGERTIFVTTRFGRSKYPELGFDTAPMSKQLAQYFGVDRGVLIITVHDRSPASKAALKAGDVILEVGGKPIAFPKEIEREIGDNKESSINLTIVRDRKPQQVRIAIEPERPY